METFILMLVIAYSTAKDEMPGGAAVTTTKEYFTSRENCEDEAEKAMKRLTAKDKFKRVEAWCMHRWEPGQDLLPKPTLRENQKRKG